MPDYSPKLVVGRGNLHFNRFKDGTNVPISGEHYFGNTPELSTTTDDTSLDHYSSEEGFKVMDESITLQSDMTGTFTTDHISIENLALFFHGAKTERVIAPQVGVVEKFTVQRGTYIQLGMTNEPHGSGVRWVENVTVDGIPNLEDNFELDLERGRLYVEPDAPDLDDMVEYTFNYDVRPQSRTQVISKGKQIRGSLRFIGKNPHGENIDHFWPSVTLMPNGDYALKGDDWQQMSFNFRVLQVGSKTVRHIAETPSVLLDSGNGDANGETPDSGTDGATPVVEPTAPATGT